MTEIDDQIIFQKPSNWKLIASFVERFTIVLHHWTGEVHLNALRWLVCHLDTVKMALMWARVWSLCWILLVWSFRWGFNVVVLEKKQVTSIHCSARSPYPWPSDIELSFLLNDFFSTNLILPTDKTKISSDVIELWWFDECIAESPLNEILDALLIESWWIAQRTKMCWKSEILPSQSPGNLHLVNRRLSSRYLDFD